MSSEIIEIPTLFIEPLLQYAAETEQSVEDVITAAIKEYLKRSDWNA